MVLQVLLGPQVYLVQMVQQVHPRLQQELAVHLGLQVKVVQTELLVQTEMLVQLV